VTYRKRITHRHMTPARRRWLEHLAKHGPATASMHALKPGIAAFHCRVLGWSAWAEKNSYAEAITDLGRDALRKLP
jgi:hypothetical protein